MEPLDQYKVDRGNEPPPPLPPRRDNRAAIAVAVIVLVVGAVAVGLLVWRRPAPTPAAVQAPVQAPAEDTARPPLGPAVEPAELPPLDLSDPLVRELLSKLSSRPEVAAWLATDGLIRNFVVSLDNVATGASPARHLKVLAPGAPFETERRGDRTVASPRAYERYTGLAETVAALDPAGLARIYALLKPRLIEAYQELGHPEGDIDAAVERALVRLLDTPVPQGDVALKRGIVSFKFDSERIEALSPAQKQLVRMGPANMRLVQGHLWALGRELGIPPERLPAPPQVGR